MTVKPLSTLTKSAPTRTSVYSPAVVTRSSSRSKPGSYVRSIIRRRHADQVHDLNNRCDNSMRIFLLMIVALAAHQNFARAQTVRVLVWDEQQDRQAEAYENFLGNEI